MKLDLKYCNPANLGSEFGKAQKTSESPINRRRRIAKEIFISNLSCPVKNFLAQADLFDDLKGFLQPLSFIHNPAKAVIGHQGVKLEQPPVLTRIFRMVRLARNASGKVAVKGI